MTAPPPPVTSKDRGRPGGATSEGRAVKDTDSRTGGQRRAEAAAAWAAGVALLLFVAGRCLVPMDETDLFYNLRLGEIVLATHGVPRTNLLSFTVPDYPDPNLAWLFQIVLALAYRAGGVPGTVLLKTAFVVATFALLFRVALRRGAHPAVAAAALALAAWAAEPRFVERPHLVTFLGLATLLMALERAEAGRPLLLWMMIPLGLVWANGNSCFFLAPAVLTLHAIGARLDGGGAPADRTAARRAGVVAVALVPLLFATPAGAGWLGYVANHFRMPSVRPLQEYRAAAWPIDAPFLFLLIAVALFTVIRRRDARTAMVPTTSARPARSGEGAPPAGRFPLSAGDGQARHLFPILALAMLGSRRVRFVAEFALLAGPYVAARATRWVRPSLGRAGGRPERWLSAAAAPILAALALVPRVQATRGGAPFMDLNIEDGLVPDAAIRWLDRQGLRERLYNDLEVGSYLAWDGWPRHRVFQDPRINAYPAAWHALLRRSDLPRPAWQNLMDRFNIQAALITYPQVNPRAAWFDPGLWALCYQTDEALVFVRRGGGHASLVAATERPVTFRFDAASGVAPVPLSQPPAGSPIPMCEWNRRLGETHLALHDWEAANQDYRAALAAGAGCLSEPARAAAREQAGTLALRFAEPDRAAALLGGLPSPTARTNLGFALVQLERSSEALAEFDGALAAAPDTPEAAFGRALALTALHRQDQARIAWGDFLQRWPRHFAAREARARLARLVEAAPRP